ncbi:DUF3237 family protein [Paraburkholderia sacchari]|uniref:DUF3237 family protein n=1 Tax=Paraburkholderia sacchari TaxID=159450 RepID=UPI001BCEA5F9
MLALRPCFRLDIELGAAIDIGPTPSGHRRVTPITGGTFEGERVREQIVCRSKSMRCYKQRLVDSDTIRR